MYAGRQPSDAVQIALPMEPATKRAGVPPVAVAGRAWPTRFEGLGVLLAEYEENHYPSASEDPI